MAYKVKQASAAGNSYNTSSLGVLRKSPNTALFRAGIIQPIQPDLTLTADATGIVMAQYDSFAYRVFFCYRDTNNNLIMSPPSSRVIVYASAAGTYRINVKVNINGELTTSHFFRIYRTKKRAGSSTTYIDPGEEVYLDYQDFFTTASLTAGSITIQDRRADEILGEPAYTNPSRETIVAANFPPPYCRVLAYFKNHMFYMNVLQPQTLTITLIGTSVPAAGTITVAGSTYTASNTATTDITDPAPAGENKNTGTFVNYNLVTDISKQIEGTARSLCRVINGYPANTSVYAYYDSEAGGTPGIIRLVERGINGSPFSVVSSFGSKWDPILPSSGTTISSTNNEAIAGCFISKPEQPDHVVLGSFRVVGDRTNPITNAFALKDSLITTKYDGVYRCSGSSLKDFVFAPLDPTVSIRDSFESEAALDNKVFAVSNQGPVSISETGVELVGRAEEYNILKGIIGFTDGFTNGIGIEPRRMYLFCTYDPELKQKSLANPGSYPYPYSTFAYNYATGTWTRMFINSNCFAVLNDRIYYGLNNNKGIVMEERLPTVADQTNYYDETCSVTITAINTTTRVVDLTFTKSVDYDGYFTQWDFINQISPGFENLSYGWVIQSGNNQYVVLSYNSGTGKALLNTVSGLVNGTYSVFRPIPVVTEYMATFAGNPASLKNFQEVVIFGDFSNSYQVSLDFMNQNDYKDFRHYYTWNSSLTKRVTKPIVDIITKSNSLTPKNAMKFRDSFIREQVPREKRDGQFLSVRISSFVANSSFVLKGICYVLEENDTVKLIQ